jgi:hypothetical protein
MYGYRTVAGYCVDCMTHEEAIEVALMYTNATGNKFRVVGEQIQHIGKLNVTNQNIYCYKVQPLGVQVGRSKAVNQGPTGKAWSNGRAVRSST